MGKGDMTNWTCNGPRKNKANLGREFQVTPPFQPDAICTKQTQLARQGWAGHRHGDAGRAPSEQTKPIPAERKARASAWWRRSYGGLATYLASAKQTQLGRSGGAPEGETCDIASMPRFGKRTQFPAGPGGGAIGQNKPNPGPISGNTSPWRRGPVVPRRAAGPLGEECRFR